ncbi:MAG: hypothetical protein AAGG50_13035 [Bacteroidota bacterium]
MLDTEEIDLALMLDVGGVLAAAAFALFFGRAFWANRHLLAPDEPRFSDPELRRLLGRTELSDAERASAKARRTRFGLAFAASLVWLCIALVFLLQHGT